MEVVRRRERGAGPPAERREPSPAHVEHPLFLLQHPLHQQQRRAEFFVLFIAPLEDAECQMQNLQPALAEVSPRASMITAAR